jgi:hypothetical protein
MALRMAVQGHRLSAPGTSPRLSENVVSTGVPSGSTRMSRRMASERREPVA